MIGLDRWILERVVEPASCEIESWTGVGPYRLARFFVVMMIAVSATRALRDHGYVAFGVSLMWGTALMLMSFVSERESKGKSTANWLRHDLAYGLLRLLNVAMMLVSVLVAPLTGQILEMCGSIADCMAICLIACERQPPKERRLLLPVEAPQGA